MPNEKQATLSSHMPCCKGYCTNNIYATLVKIKCIRILTYI